MNWDASGDILPPALAARLAAARASIRSRQPIDDGLVAGLIGMLPDRKIITTFGQFGPHLTQAWARIAMEHGSEHLMAVNRAMVIELALTLPHRIRDLALPPSVLAGYPAAYARMLNYLEDPAAPYDSAIDPFVKDLRLFSGISVPAGSRIVDLNGHVGRRLSLHYWQQQPSLGALRGISLRHGLTPWLCVHIDPRSMAGLGHLTDFNEASWDSCYRVIADVLAWDSRLLGLVGTSWFFDPALEEFSPYMAYLYRRPVERGAILIRQ
ncbi:MAG: hypothetical protein K2X44_02425 [Magnetospirillum sp.]|nr:hypothetical protein [Magnetospirillum sp.]